MVLKGKAPVDSECKAKLGKVQDVLNVLNSFKILTKLTCHSHIIFAIMGLTSVVFLDSRDLELCRDIFVDFYIDPIFLLSEK